MKEVTANMDGKGDFSRHVGDLKREWKGETLLYISFVLCPIFQFASRAKMAARLGSG